MFALATHSGRGAPKNDEAVQNWCCIVRHIDFFFWQSDFSCFARHILVKLKDDALQNAFCIYSFFGIKSSCQVHDPCWQYLVLQRCSIESYLSIFLSIYIYFSNDSKPSHPTRRGRCLKLPCSPDQLPTALLLFCCFDADHEGLLPWCPAVVSVSTIRSAPHPPGHIHQADPRSGEREPDAQLASI